MRQFRTISLFAAFLLVMLHAVIPHVHHEDLSYSDDIEEHNDAESWVDYLALAFHLDHDQGDLEQFTSGDEIDADFDLAISIDFIAVNELKLSISGSATESFKDPDTRALETRVEFRQLRGPPVLS